MTAANRGAPDDLDALALAAIAYQPTEAEVRIASVPPYLAPRALDQFYAASDAALRERMRAGGPDPLFSTRLFETPSRFSDGAASGLSERSRRFVSDAVCALLAGGLISVRTAERAVASCPGRPAARFIQRAIVYRLLADGDLVRAMEAADSPVFGDETWVGWRAVGDHHAANGEADAFLKLWPNYGATHERGYLNGMRVGLVDAVSRRHGWRAAVALAGDKRMSAKAHVNGLVYVALRPLAEAGDAKALDGLLAAEDLPGLDEVARLKLLVDAMDADETPGEADHPDLAWILPRVVAVDPTVSKLQSRRRDWLLLGLWPLIGDPATLKKVRAAIRAPSYRREITALRPTFEPRRVSGP